MPSKRTYKNSEDGTLAPRQAAFVREYLLCRNAAEAARRAGYAEKDAKGQGHRLLYGNKAVREAIQEAEEKADKRALRSLEEHLRLLEQIAFETPRATAAERQAIIAAVREARVLRGWGQENVNVSGEVGIAQIVVAAHQRRREAIQNGGAREDA